MRSFLTVILMSAGIVFCAFGQNGVLREMSGEVEIKAAGASSFSAARIGDTIAQNTIVSTGFRGTAVIEVGSSLITVRPLTRLSLSEIQRSSNTENVNVNLQTGRVRVDVNPPAGTKTNLTVQSTVASASVRGTVFEFDTYNLNVNEGSVVFGGSSGPVVMVNPGNNTFVGNDGAPVNPVVVASSSLAPSSPVGAPPPETTTAAAVINYGDMSINLDYD
ncbi:MAG: FecR family protein [Treponema sp.]|nr:FecR family protein [Treponema sp.]